MTRTFNDDGVPVACSVTVIRSFSTDASCEAFFTSQQRPPPPPLLLLDAVAVSCREQHLDHPTTREEGRETKLEREEEERDVHTMTPQPAQRYLSHRILVYVYYCIIPTPTFWKGTTTKCLFHPITL